VFSVSREYGFDVRDIIDFSSSINPLGPPSSALERLAKSTWMIPFYPDPSYHDFRQHAADYVGVGEENVIEGNGSTELIYLFSSLFIRRGDRVVLPVPTFGEYERAIRMSGGVPVHVGPNRDFALSLDNVREQLAKGCRAIFLCNPNNPTSLAVAKKDLLDLLGSALNVGAYVFLDETFVEFADDQDLSLVSRLSEFPNLFIIRSLTKFFALTGLRIGYGLAPAQIAEKMRSEKIPWSVNTLAQEAAMAAFRDDAYIEKTKRVVAEEREFLYSQLRKINQLEPIKPDANFVFLRISHGFTAPGLKRLLLDKRLLVRDCSSFQGLGGNHIRVAVKLRRENSLLLSTLKEVMN
jgi:threonine-phosphate decarboxylase